MNLIAETVRKNLKIAREAADLTQQQLAERLSRSKGTVTQWECGTREIHYDALLELAPALGRSWLWFYQNREQDTPQPILEASASEPTDEEVSKWNRIQYKRARGLDLSEDEKAFLTRLYQDEQLLGFSPSQGASFLDRLQPTG